MNSIFAKRRARLLAMKAMRDNYIPGDQLTTCPKCGQESLRREVAGNLAVCPKCGYHFPIGGYYRLSTILDPGSFRELNGKLSAGDPPGLPRLPGKAGCRSAENRPDGGRRHRRRHYRRAEMRGGRAGQPLSHGQHERGRGRENHSRH